jgi:hypothetical protein
LTTALSGLALQLLKALASSVSLESAIRTPYYFRHFAKHNNFFVLIKRILRQWCNARLPVVITRERVSGRRHLSSAELWMHFQAICGAGSIFGIK